MVKAINVTTWVRQRRLVSSQDERPGEGIRGGDCAGELGPDGGGPVEGGDEVPAENGDVEDAEAAFLVDPVEEGARWEGLGIGEGLGVGA